MNRAGEIATQVVRRAPQPAELTMRSLSQDQVGGVEVLVNQLFREIRTARSAWRQAWNTTEVLEATKVTWVKTFLENGINDWDSQIAFGLQALRAEPTDFVPSPGKFASWCYPTPESMALPPLEMAYAEALRKSHPGMSGAARWSCPAVYHAAARAGFSNLQTLARADGMQLLEKHYRQIRCHLAKGGTIDPVPVAAIAAQPNRTPEVGNSALAALRSKLKGVPHV
ncbi:replication protein P [Pseudomonas nitroreducens]|uniref:replication protein P n=1 Tax=Pseudomonas nitroreducens TaxID=46680 RepID=UPI003CC81DCF